MLVENFGNVRTVNKLATTALLNDKFVTLTADNLTTFMCRLSGNLGASTFWNPQGLSRSVKELLLHTTHPQQ
jgi:hypothetical protein